MKLHKSRSFKSLFFILGVLAMLLVLSFYVKADILSVNSGGGNGIIINPDRYINSFFSQPPPTPTPTPSPTPTPTPSGGGGGGGVTPAANIEVNPTSINLTLAVNTNVPQEISITNTGSADTTVNISQENLTGLIILSNSSISLLAGETKNITATFVAPNQTGIYNGTIIVGGIKIPVSLTIKKVTLLFDSRITILNPNAVVLQGKPLETRVTLIPMGDRVRVDVTLDYKIISSNGTVMQTMNETVLVDSLRSLLRNFDTGTLPPGNYVIKLDLIYPNGVAPSSAPFTVIAKTSAQILLGYFIFFLLIAILFVVIMIIMVFIIRIINEARVRKKLAEQDKSGLKPWNRPNNQET